MSNTTKKFERTEQESDTQQQEQQQEHIIPLAERDDIAVIDLRSNNDFTVKPSHLLQNEEWLQQTIELFSVEKLVPSLTVDDAMKEKADLLVGMLRDRMKSLVKRRINSKEKQEHWALKLASKNLAVVAAYMVLADHVKEDLTFLDSTKSILHNTLQKYLLCASFPKQAGAYMYYDIINAEFVRSGKVGSRGFQERHIDHMKAANKLDHNSSNFYFNYPSRNVITLVGTAGRSGTFESLTQCVAAGFDPSGELAMSIVHKRVECGGIMIMNDDDVRRIESSVKKNETKTSKFNDYLAYLFELGYDLAINTAVNMSSNPGFESFVGVFGNA